MNEVISLFYGLFMVGLIYGVSAWTVKGLSGKGFIPFYVILGKYFIYWKLIEFGFKSLNSTWILVGVVSGIYLSLPLVYYLSKKKLED